VSDTRLATPMIESAPLNPDQETLRKASIKIAVRISAACAVLVLCLLAAASAYLLHQTGQPVSGPSEPDAVYAYLDTNDIIEAMVIAGVGGIVLAGGVGWLSARSAIRPLGQALALQRRFVQDASHEMRTPLAILDARIQLAQRETPSDSGPGLALARIREDAAALTSLVNELLEAATGSNSEHAPTPCSAAEIVAGVVESLRQIAEEQRVTLQFSATGHSYVIIDPSRLRRAVLALTDNALAHTPPGGHITVATFMLRNQVVITVKDTGPGIRGVEPDSIFDRFVRAPKPTGSTVQPGFGIGLALVREIATSAGGSVEVASSGPQGTTMRMTMPAAAKGLPTT
jgi:two-component system OmpR family sensor kinase